VLKDRLYTTQAGSVARRSAQTAMYHIAEAMVRWLAPILSFTAEEIWQALPGTRGESVFLETWHEMPSVPDETPVDWSAVLQVRQVVAKQLEGLRAAGDIGAPLDAVVTVYCDGELADSLRTLGDELRFVFITSGAAVRGTDERLGAVEAGGEANGTSFWVGVERSVDDKCVRCWHRRPDVGSAAEHVSLCGRCVANVAGGGESRTYV
jgi:isoleucyl-tRNA synthetase